jgi:negative regulator of sigma E activity
MTEGQRPPQDSTPDSNPASNESRHGERDSQISAMFDGELSAAECELLARRLARDEALRAQWSRFALIGAALRAERGVKLHDRIANRVQAALVQEPTYGDSAADGGAVAVRPAARNTGEGAYERWLRFARPVVGASIAAGVAAVSILWLRTQEPDPSLVSTPAPTPTPSIVLEPEAASPPPTMVVQTETAPVSNGEPERYSTPAPSSQTSLAPPARFANYVVAHSEYSGPLARRMALLGILGTESPAEANDTAKPAAGEVAKVQGTNDAP